MTKSEKKKIISVLLTEIISSTDSESNNNKLEKVVSEIRSAGYKSNDLDRVNTIINAFTADFEKHQDDKSFLQLSRAGLITCIDWSLLPD